MTRSVSSDSSSPAAVNRFRPVGPSTGDGGWSLPHRRGTLHGGRPGRTVGGGAHPAAGPVAAGTAATATAYGAVLAAALGLGALAVPGGPVRLVMLLAFVTLGPGAAVICHVRVTDRLVEWALAVTASLTATAAVATAMVWVHLWQPVAAQAAMASAVGVSGLVALINRRPRPEPARELVGNALLWYDTGAVDPRPAGTLTHGPRSNEAETRVIAVATTHTRQVLRAVGMARVGGSPAIEPAASKTGIAAFLGTGPVALLGVAVLLWVVSMLRYQPERLDGYGLTRAMGVLFVGAVVAVGLSFAIELIGRARTTVLAGGVLVVTVILNATVPLLYREPEYAWTYKHLGVIDLLRDHGAVVDHTDIYQQWPAFFALVAEVSATARVDALAFAAWSPLFFTLLDGLLLAALLKQVTSSRRVVLLGVFLFESCLWVCINYLSPQAFAFALALGFWVILTRWLIAMPVPSKVGNGRLRRRRTALFYGLPTPSALGGRRTPALAVVGAVAVFAVITASHQLSPFLIITPILLLTVFGAIRPRWLIIPLGLILAGYVLPRLGPLGEQYR
ncbi:MAG: hypothetical protein QOE03_3320, partial [Micromonosporaceae bacterium]|nr:hypothetical protein [Micromonosporaceae bacterium]